MCSDKIDIGWFICSLNSFQTLKQSFPGYIHLLFFFVLFFCILSNCTILFTYHRKFKLDSVSIVFFSYCQKFSLPCESMENFLPCKILNNCEDCKCLECVILISWHDSCVVIRDLSGDFWYLSQYGQFNVFLQNRWSTFWCGLHFHCPSNFVVSTSILIAIPCSS